MGCGAAEVLRALRKASGNNARWLRMALRAPRTIDNSALGLNEHHTAGEVRGSGGQAPGTDAFYVQMYASAQPTPLCD